MIWSVYAGYYNNLLLSCILHQGILYAPIREFAGFVGFPGITSNIIARDRHALVRIGTNWRGNEGRV